jgi:sugar/nucleoside kinase (ribokinase family)
VTVAVVGSIAFDSVRTPFGEVERELGGSGLHAALTASFFTDVRLVAAVGEDFGPEHRRPLVERNVGTSAIAVVPGGRTLNWRVRYDLDMALAQPEYLDLGVFAGWRPRLSPDVATARTLFLGAMDPEAQMAVRARWKGDGWTVLDTLTYWVETKRQQLVEALSMADIALLTDQEARGLVGEPSLLDASREIQSWGPKVVVVKRGDNGCSLLTPDGYFALPGYPLETVVDPTGSGDSFAGGFIGYLDRVTQAELTEAALRGAATYGTIMASFCVEDFGARRTTGLTQYEIDHRVAAFRRMTHFEHVPTGETPRVSDEADVRLERPQATPSTRGFDSPSRTPSTETRPGFARTPGTQPMRIIENPTRDPS